MSWVSSAGLVISTSGRDHGYSPPIATLSLLIIYVYLGRAGIRDINHSTQSK